MAVHNSIAVIMIVRVYHTSLLSTYKMREELDMLFLLEHFSLEDLVKAEEEYINYESKNTDNIAESYVDVEEYIDDECTATIMTRRYDVCVDDSWMDLSFESLVFNKD